jgi:hypothetical protein
VSVKAVVSSLSAVGAESVRVRSTKTGEQSRWLLPVDQFPPADYTAQAQEPARREEHDDKPE